MIEMFDSGCSLREIADGVGCSMSTASRYLTASGRSAWDRRYPQTEGRDEDAMIQDYQNYMPLTEILHKYHISQTTLYRRLREREIETRPKRPSMLGKNNPQYKHGKSGRPDERNPVLMKQVAAACLGMVVPRGWIIHHIDGNPQNNRPENLAVFRTRRDHQRMHQQLLMLQRIGRPVDASQMVLKNNGILLPVPDHPLTFPHEKGRLDPPQNQEKTERDQKEKKKETV